MAKQGARAERESADVPVSGSGASAKADGKNRQTSPTNQSEHAARSAYAYDGQVTCPNCGGALAADDARCPYCGALNPSGAEKAYMDALDDIKDETGELADDAEDEIESDLRHNTKRTITIVIAVIAALATLFLAVNCMNRSEEQQELRDYQAREAFRAQYFEEFDRLYESGDDDALSEYVWSLLDEPGFDALSSWKHSGYLEVHDGWEALRATSDHIEAGTCTLDDYTWSVSLAIRLAQLDAEGKLPSAALSQEEEQRAAGYRDYARQFLQDVLQMNAEEVAAFADDVKDEQGYVQQDKLKPALEKRLKQTGALR